MIVYGTINSSIFSTNNVVHYFPKNDVLRKRVQITFMMATMNYEFIS